LTTTSPPAYLFRPNFSFFLPSPSFAMWRGRGRGREEGGSATIPLLHFRSLSPAHACSASLPLLLPLPHFGVCSDSAQPGLEKAGKEGAGLRPSSARFNPDRAQIGDGLSACLRCFYSTPISAAACLHLHLFPLSLSPSFLVSPCYHRTLSVHGGE